VVFVLAVKFNEPARQIPERASRRQLAIDIGAAAPLGCDLARSSSLPRPTRRSPRSRHPPVNEVPEAWPPSRSPTASTRIDFAGTGFSAEHVGLRLELNVHGVNNEAFDGEKAQHGVKEREVHRNIGLDSCLRRATVLHALKLPARVQLPSIPCRLALSQRRTN
jgi:hypothetical protein